MKKVLEKAITRGDIRFWAFLVGVATTIVAWGVRLEMKVIAQEEYFQSQHSQLSNEVDDTAKLINEIHDRVIRIDTNQAHIMRALNIEIED